jgi:hypothetical protein
LISSATTRTKLVFLLTIFLTACGGGSSGGGGQANDAPDQASPAVTYNGTATFTLTAPGFTTINDTVPVQIVVQGNNVTLTVEGVSVNTTLNNGAFSVTVPVSETEDGITCKGSATASGTVSGNSINGKLSGNATCTGNGLNVPVTLTGSFNAQASGP